MSSRLGASAFVIPADFIIGEFWRIVNVDHDLPLYVYGGQEVSVQRLVIGTMEGCAWNANQRQWVRDVVIFSTESMARLPPQ